MSQGVAVVGIEVGLEGSSLVLCASTGVLLEVPKVCS